MSPGDLVIIPGTKRKGVVFRVGKKELRSGVNANKAGLFVFSGYWHGKNPKLMESYGKIQGQIGRVVGRVRGHFQAKKVCA